MPGGFDGSLGGFAEQGLELGEDLLDGVEIGAVGGQEQEFRAGSADGLADSLALVATEIVHDDDVAWFERRYQNLLDIGEEAPPVDRSVDDARGIDAIDAERGKEGECPPAAMRHLGSEPSTPGAAAMPPRHVGLRPSLVDEDEPRGIKLALMGLPADPAARHVGPVLLARVHGFF